jgi:hypothetical protein
MRISRLAAAPGVALLAAALVVATPRAAHAAFVPGTTCNVFPSDNIWNTDISHLPVNANSATWIGSTMPASGLTHPDFGGPPYGIPYNLATNATPTKSFNFTYAGESDPGPYPIPSSPQIEGGSDRHMLVLNKDTCKLYETFATDLTTNPPNAGSGAIFDLNSNQLRTAGFTSADAAGLPIFPGLLRFDEVNAGFVGHAIRFTVHNTDNTYLWPARHQAGINDPTLPPMGARFRLKMSYNDPSLGAEAQVVLTAFKHYGLIVADNGSDWYFQGTEDASWDDPLISDLKKIPVNQFEAVDESSLQMAPDSAQVGTAPLAPTAPTAAPGDASARVTWIAPANGGQPITGYTITGIPSGSAVAAAGATSAVVHGLTNGLSYTFTVRATNVIGTGPPSPASNAVVPNHRITAQGPPGSAPSRGPVTQSTVPVSPHPGRMPASRPLVAVPPVPRPATAWPRADTPPRVYLLRI